MQRILVIDDDDSFRAMLRKTLQTAGYEVQAANNGNAALDLYREGRPDLVITDLIMPEKEGIETILELRQIDPAVKIIAISGGARIDPAVTLPAARILGARRTLAKPFSQSQILKTVAEVLAEAA